MNPRHLVAAVASGFAIAAMGQAVPDVPHDGNWSPTIQAAGGSRQSAKFVIRDYAANWIGASGRQPGDG